MRSRCVLWKEEVQAVLKQSTKQAIVWLQKLEGEAESQVSNTITFEQEQGHAANRLRE